MTNDIERSKQSKMKRRPPEWDSAKIDLAKELGLWEKVEAEGWGALSAAESGKLGGMLAKKFPGKAPKLPPKGQLPKNQEQPL